MKTAVEWQFEQFFNSFEKFNNRECTFNDYLKRNLEILEQAKEMYNQQKKDLVIGTYIDLKMKDYKLPYGMKYLDKISELEEEAEQYYNQTFNLKEQ
jgi:hypothetical protein